MKVVYVIDSLASKGGAERIISEKMSYLTDHFGYDVTVVTCYQPASLPNVYPISGNVKQINLCIPYYSQYRVGYPKRLFVKLSYYRSLQRQLRGIVEKINPDILVGVSYFKADMLCKIKCKAAKVIEAHESRLFTLQLDGKKESVLKRLFTRFYEWWYFRRVEHRAHTVVCLTKGDAQLWHKARRVEVIPNFSIMPISRISNCDTKRVIAVGRLEWQKGYDMLIDAWAEVEKRHPDWQLFIFGSGRAEQQLRQQIAEMKLQSVNITSFTSDISEEYAKSSFLVLSSHFEGFPLVMLEAQRHALPIVAFKCPFGPEDVIEDGKCGYLVTMGDLQTFSQKIFDLIENPSIRKQFSVAAFERAKIFDVDKIMLRWKKLFEEFQKES